MPICSRHTASISENLCCANIEYMSIAYLYFAYGNFHFSRPAGRHTHTHSCCLHSATAQSYQQHHFVSANTQNLGVCARRKLHIFTLCSPHSPPPLLSSFLLSTKPVLSTLLLQAIIFLKILFTPLRQCFSHLQPRRSSFKLSTMLCIVSSTIQSLLVF